MKKKITILSVICILLLLTAFVGFAQTTYKITYDYGVADIRAESIVNTNPTSFTKAQVIKLADAVCPGFEFVGWYTDRNYKTQVYIVDTFKESDITLYAKWYEMSYNINYVLETPGIELSADEISNENPLTRLASEMTYISDPVCDSDDYIFCGWYTDSKYKNKIDYIEEYTFSDVTLYAKWVSTKYSVFYELGDVTLSVYPTENPNPESYEYNKELILTDAVTSDPAYTFDGWYSDEFFSEKITTIEKGTSGDIVLYAKWNKKEYNINYVLDDKSGIDSEQIHNNNPTTNTASTVLLLNDPISDDRNFVFDGWYTSADYTYESKISSLPATQYTDITLYAKWKHAVYKITYDYLNVSTLYCPVENSNPETYEFGDNTVLADVEAEGFIFNGWCTDKNLKNKITQIPATSFGDITLYADFTEKTYSVTYVLDDKEVKASQVVNKNPGIRTTSQQVSLAAAETINTDYVFAGWYLDKEFTEEIEYIKSYTTGNITLYAKWIKNVTYIPCWGDATLSQQLSAADARLILRYAAGLETGFNDVQKRVSDINNDGAVNAADARLALRMSASIDKEEDLIEKYSLPEIKTKDGEIVFE